MSAEPVEERQAVALAHALNLPDGEMDIKILRDALPKIRRLVDSEIEAQAPKTRRRLANDERFGDFYGTSSTMKTLGVQSPQQLSDRIRRHTLLRVKLEDGKVNAFPAFQFKNHQVIPELKPILQVLIPAAATEWTVARWLTLHQPALQGQKPIDILRGEAEVDVPLEQVLNAAKETARDWSS
ncbi:hypothetical protein AUR04nite_07250 [Glutamicibacter uratoxydans]|uniref:Antitoxin Xre/MbcA/ParS-like toxin-binding domain-containing protein n=1 Tax=Glutamicibacter uratoxydans TaxID=43667 RepID=A0A4Y4DKS1_GLUUR|nr:hypothetical protein [Glutamicibacter uratoxydans]GED05193.1 hypothetical protein AUR04nite_07250 [Glutamicibacter uratoxydans]